MCCLRKNRLEPAFTLVELVATSALAGLLIVATLSVIASVGRTRNAFDRGAARDPWPGGLIEMIRWDLVNARRLEILSDRVVMSGFNHLDAVTLVPGHRPVEVVYAVERIEGRAWLTRTQRPTHVGATDGAWKALVAADVGEIVVERVKRQGESAATSEMPAEVKMTIRPARRDVGDVVRVIQVR